MRLIDGDALSECLDKRRTYEIMNGRNRAYGKGVRDAMNDVDAAPTIDAIPVKWLKQKMKHSDNYTRGSAKWMLGCWKREQEAR